MTSVFADSSYYLGLLNRDDEQHAAAIAATRRLEGPIVTTVWVLTEVVDALSQPQHRAKVAGFLRSHRANPQVMVVPATNELFDRGLDLHAQRPGKAWSLTDCISFIAMADHALGEALTADRHFEQAGFRALLR